MFIFASKQLVTVSNTVEHYTINTTNNRAENLGCINVAVFLGVRLNYDHQQKRKKYQTVQEKEHRKAA